MAAQGSGPAAQSLLDSTLFKSLHTVAGPLPNLAFLQRFPGISDLVTGPAFSEGARLLRWRFVRAPRSSRSSLPFWRHHDSSRPAEIHAAMESGELTARGLVEVYLERIAAYDQSGPAINAIILVNPNAIARAEALDELFARSGLSGSLHGIPVLLKDNVETGDMPTTGGSLAPRRL